MGIARRTRPACRRVIAATGLLVLLTTQTAVAEDARRRREGHGTAFSGCAPSVGQGRGAYVELSARDSVLWAGASHATVEFAYNDSSVHDCLQSGKTVTGGKLTFDVRLEFIGDQIQSCSAGFPAGTSCTIDPHHNQATYSFSYGPVDNNSGQGSYHVTGAEVDAGNTGHVYSVKFTAATTYSIESSATTATKTIDLHY